MKLTLRIINFSLFLALFLAVLYWGYHSLPHKASLFLYESGCNEAYSLQPRFVSTGNGTISPNTAGKDELMLIPGIGEKTAQAIIDEREQNGVFYYPEDLLAVPGIGVKKLAQFLPFLSFPASEEQMP